MANFNDLGGVSILGFISPFNTGDTYPVIDPLYGIDGFRNVSNVTELNSIPNARRRAGMVVGVNDGTEYYKLNSSPWSGNLSDWTLIYLTNSPITGFTYNGNDNTFTLTDGYGVSLNAYLNSISGLTSTGVISSNTLSATTYLNLPLDIFITGGTYNNNLGSVTFVNNTGGTFNVDGFFTGGTEVFVTGGTYNNNLGSATFVNNTGGTFNVDGFFTGQTDTVLSAFTYNNANTLTVSDTSGNAFSSTVNTMTGLTVTGAISAATISGGTFFGDGSNLGGVVSGSGAINYIPKFISSTGIGNSTIYDSGSGNIGIGTTNPSGLQINSSTTETARGVDNVRLGIIAGTPRIIFEDAFNSQWEIDNTGGTLRFFQPGLVYAQLTTNDFQARRFTDYDNPIYYLDPAGATSGVFAGNIQMGGGLVANSVSATTYLNLPLDIKVTGGTYNSNTGVATFTNNTGGTFNVTGFLTGFTDIFTTGSTFDSNSNIITFTRNDGNTYTTVLSGVSSVDTFVTGFTYSSDTLTIFQNENQPPLSATLPTTTLESIFSAATFDFNTTGSISATSISATTYLNLPLDIRVTGGTYNNMTGEATFVNNTGGTFNIGGFFTGSTDVFVTGGTYNTNTGEATFINNTGGTFNISGFFTGSTDIFVTGGTYNNVTGDATFVNNTGGTFTITGFTSGVSSGGYVNNIIPSGTTITVPQNEQYIVYGNLNILSGGTLDNFGNVVIINGTLNNSGVYNNTGGTTTFVSFPTGDTFTTSATLVGNTIVFDTTVSPNAYSVDLSPILTGVSGVDVFVTGGTYNTNTGEATFINNTGGTFNVTGFTTGSTDTFVTGLTYSNNTLTVSRNQGLPNLSTNINSFTGLTINGDLNVTGNTVMSAVTASTISNVDYIDFTTTFTGSIPSSRVAWSAEYGTLELGLNGGAVTNLVGQETVYYVKNQSTPGPGFTINRGQVAAAIGTVGSGSSGRILAGLGIANGSIPDITIMGIATDNIVNGDDGYVTAFGKVRNINTTGSLYGESWSAGTILYVSHTVAGGLTSIIPPSPNLKIPIAIVIYAHATNGIIFVRPTFKSNLKDLYDVQSSGQTNGDLLVYNSGTSTWNFTKSLTGDYNLNGSLSGTSFNANSVNTNTLIVSGSSQLNGQISSTNLSGSTDRLLQVSSGGTFTATTQVIPAYITSGATVANLLDDTNNWDINGNYTGATITNTFQGQKHYNPSYFFEAVDDNLWIRLIRG